ncbi:unnamed protein product [Trichobilharzia regenti]|nr:unnamed protein product [Trichobilharzia regenti]
MAGEDALTLCDLSRRIKREFYMDLLYITFPFRYKFRDIYQEASSIRRFLRKLQSNESIYHELDESTPTDELTYSSSIPAPNDTRTGSSKFFLESPTAMSPPPLPTPTGIPCTITTTTTTTTTSRMVSNLLLDSDSVSKTTPIINHDRILHIKVCSYLCLSLSLSLIVREHFALIPCYFPTYPAA